MTVQWTRDGAARDLLERLEQASAAAVLTLPTDAADDEKRRERVEATRAAAFDQPEAIAKTLEALERPVRDLVQQLANRSIRRVYLTGAGDSWFAAVGVRLLFERLLRIPAEAVEVLEYAHYYYATTDADSMVIAISASGNTPRVLEAVYRGREAGAFTIGVTLSEPSALTTGPEAYLRVPASRAGWPTQASTCTMAALALLAIRLAEAQGSASQQDCRDVLSGLRDMPAHVQSAIKRSDPRMAALGEELRNAPVHLFAGGGPSLAAASFGAAKVKELCPVHAVAMPVEEYHHYRSQKRGDPLFLVAPIGQSTRRALDTIAESKRVGGRTIAVVTEGDPAFRDPAVELVGLSRVHDGLVAILFAVPLHLYAYHLAIAKFRHGEGYPPGLFEHEQ